MESLQRQRFSTAALVYPGAELDPQGTAWPFPPPYGARIDGGYYSTFPPYFSLVTVPFYRALGFAGLRVLPFLGGVATLVAGWLLLRQLALSPVAELVGVVLLAFGSPIAFYAATFWEHAPALALCSFAVVLAGSTFSDAADASSATRPTREATRWLLAGACCGAAFALRSEAAVFGLAVAWAMTWMRLRAGRGPLAIAWFLAGGAIPVGGVLGLNQWWFGHPLGLLREHFVPNPASRFDIVWELLVDLDPSLIGSNGLFPLFPILLVGVVALFRLRRGSSLVGFHALVGTAFVVAMLFVAPNAGGKQFGPRYLLLAWPSLLAAAVAMAPAAKDFPSLSAHWRRCAWVVFLVLAAVSVVRGLQGAGRLWDEKHAIEAPMLRVARETEATIIVSSHPYFAQQAASLYFEKKLFGLPVIESSLLPDLSAAGFLFEAAERGVESVLYVDAYGVPHIRSFPLVSPEGTRLLVKVGEPTVVGHYRFQLWKLERR
jgi:hypothetical protein